MNLFFKNLTKTIFVQIVGLLVLFILGIGIVFAWSSIDRNLAATSQPLSSGMMQSIIDRVNDALVPSGAVMAFNLTGCPTGWAEYVPAYGRFIRGIDKNTVHIDSDGQRSVENIQSDDFKSHTHTSYYWSSETTVATTRSNVAGNPTTVA